MVQSDAALCLRGSNLFAPCDDARSAAPSLVTAVGLSPLLGVPDGVGGRKSGRREFGAADEQVGHPRVGLVVNER